MENKLMNDPQPQIDKNGVGWCREECPNSPTEDCTCGIGIICELYVQKLAAFIRKLENEAGILNRKLREQTKRAEDAENEAATLAGQVLELRLDLDLLLRQTFM
jgi:hypothetical protein